MKRCPACRKVLPDDDMLLCPYDGTPLLDTEVIPNAFAETVGKIAGEESMPDPLLERAAAVAQKLAYKQRLSSLLGSEEGLHLADKEVESLLSYVEGRVGLIQQAHPELEIQFSENHTREAVIYSQNYLVIMSWQPEFANTLSDSSLEIVERNRSAYSKESDELNRLSLDFYMNDELQVGWKEKGGGRFLTTPKLGDECIDRLLLLISKAKG